MKRIKTISLLLAISSLGSCTPALSESQLKVANRVISRKDLGLTIAIGENRKTIKGTLSLIKSLSLTEDTKRRLVSIKKKAEELDQEFDMEITRNLGIMKYYASSDMFFTGTASEYTYFAGSRDDERHFFNSKNEIIPLKKYLIERYGYHSVCPNNRRYCNLREQVTVKKHDYDNTKSEQDRYFAIIKTIKKGELLKTQKVEVEIITISIDGKTSEEINVKKVKKLKKLPF